MRFPFYEQVELLLLLAGLLAVVLPVELGFARVFGRCRFSFFFYYYSCS